MAVGEKREREGILLSYDEPSDDGEQGDDDGLLRISELIFHAEAQRRRDAIWPGRSPALPRGLIFTRSGGGAEYSNSDSSEAPLTLRRFSSWRVLERQAETSEFSHYVAASLHKNQLRFLGRENGELFILFASATMQIGRQNMKMILQCG